MIRFLVFFFVVILLYPQTTAAQENTIKVVSWNIEYGKNYETILRELRRIDADIYILQEVDKRTKRADARDVAWEIAGELGYNYIWSEEFENLKQRHWTGFTAYTGQAVLSRWPTELLYELRFENQAANWKPTILPRRGNRWFGQPRLGGRMAQFVTVQTPHGKIIICDTHLESSVPDKKLLPQLQEALSYIAEKLEENVPIIFAGDLNTDKGLDSPVVRAISKAGFKNALSGGADEKKSTRPRKNKINDWIFVKNLRVKSASIVRRAKGSDHYPIEVILKIK